MIDDQFEWDDAKAEANFKKHKVSFHMARHVFLDERAIDTDDLGSSHDEDRYAATGMVGDKLLTVVYALRDDRIRIISAWQATKRESDDYYRGSTSS